ncbi:MAG: YraN family protein [Hyphomicrobiales bacterium]|nr:YraN family protein [Hyphomicrobiales bacterium]
MGRARGAGGAGTQGLPAAGPALYGKGGEIDLIAKRGRTIIFVEVKARAAEADAACAITAENIRPVNRRSRDWRARNPWAEGCTLRADAVFIGRGAWPRHVASVFPVDML